MAGKGNDPNCCCTGCEQPPIIWDSSNVSLQQKVSLETFCCPCVPQFACVTIALRGTPLPPIVSTYRVTSGWTAPSRGSLKVECQGGGGGGGGGGVGGGAHGGNGGGSGEYASRSVLVDAFDSFTATISSATRAAGGIAGSTDESGQNGASVTVSSTKSGWSNAIANGGKGGLGNTAGTGTGAGGSGGSGTTLISGLNGAIYNQSTGGKGGDNPQARNLGGAGGINQTPGSQGTDDGAGGGGAGKRDDGGAGGLPSVTFTFTPDSADITGSAIFKLFCTSSPTTGLGTNQPLYQINNGIGTGSISGIAVAGNNIDVTFYFLVINNQCVFAIRSLALGVDENSYGCTKIIDATQRNAPNSFCKTLSYDNAGSTKFSVFNGESWYDIYITGVDHIPITGRPNCTTENGIIIQDENPIRNICCNCDCICDCMCLTITGSDTPQSMIACLYNNSWRFSNGAVVHLGPKNNVYLDSINFLSCWSMDETSGTRLDSRGTNSLITLGNTGSATGLIEKCAKFTGDSLLYSTAQLAMSFSGISFTFTGWVNFDSLLTDQAILAKTTNGDNINGYSWKLWYQASTNTIIFTIANGTSFFSVSSPASAFILTNRWTYFVISVDNASKQMFLQINQTAIQTGLFTGTLPLTAGFLCFGGQDSTTNRQWLFGGIDQVTLWDIAITSVNISTTLIYNKGNGTPCKIDDRCYLSLIDVGDHSIVSSVSPEPVLLDRVMNPCPRPFANWPLFESPTAGQPFDHPIFYSLRCVGCDSTCTVNVPACCPDGRTNFPSIIYASVTTTCYTCQTFTIALAYQAMIKQWIGTGNMCGHPIKLTTGCGFKTLFFEGNPCTSVNATDSGGSCDPILSHFVFTSGGIGCCGGSFLTSPTINVTLFE